MKPLVVGLSGAHVVVGLTKALRRVGSDGGDCTARNDDHSMAIIRLAGVGVIDESITGLDVGGRALKIAAGASPAVDFGEAVTEVLGTDLLLAARVATARKTLVQVLVTTSEDALADKVGAITVLATVAAVVVAPVGIGSALVVSAVAVVVGTVPPLLGISNNSVAVVGGSKADKAGKSNNNNSLHPFFFVTTKKS